MGNIEEAVKDLQAKGVTFEHYDMPGTRREGEIQGEELGPASFSSGGFL